MVDVLKSDNAPFPTQEIPPCLDTARACDVCAGADPCGFLARGVAAAALHQEVTDLTVQVEQLTADKQQLLAENTRLSSAVNFLMWDQLMDRFLTRGGAELTLREPSDFRDALETELSAGRVGFITLDIRGMNFVNNNGNHAAGNILLQIVGKVIREAVRTPDGRPYEGVERRRPDAPVADLLFVRQGGDEVSIIMRNISEEDFNRRVDELRHTLSLERSLSNENPYAFPLLASVGSFHASRMTLPATWGDSDRAVADAVQILLRQADAQNNVLRTMQYKQLWEAACGMEPSLRARYAVQPEDPIVAKHFFVTHFPYFAGNIIAVLQAAQERIEAELLADTPQDDAPDEHL